MLTDELTSTPRPLGKARQWSDFVAPVLIVTTVMVAFFHAIQLNFVGDDWIFLDLVGRLDLPGYLVKYFDPRIQTAWYRPVQGVQHLLEYYSFGSDPAGYHMVNVLFHLVNCLLLYGIVTHVTGRRRTGAVAALLFATFPLAVQAVLWPGVVDPLMTVFALLSIWFWLRHLETGRPRDYGLALASFLFALYCKETGIALPVILFLIDRLYVKKPASLAALFRRYVWFAVAFVPYVPIEYIVTRRSVFLAREGYVPGAQVFFNLVDYASGLAFPWLLSPPVSYLFLALAVGIVGYAIVRRSQLALVCLLAVAVLPAAPILPFPQVSPRFLYFPLSASAFLYALGFEWIWNTMPAFARSRTLALVLVAVAVLVGSAGINDATSAFAEFSREMRVPFRNVRQAHPSFPPDTLLYFVNPPVPGPDLAGMFFSRYGRGVVVGANDSDQPARLRDHSVAYVYTFDAQGNQAEQLVDRQDPAIASPSLPLTFAGSIRLEGYELANSTIKPGEPIVLLLYWSALEPVGKDYVVFVHLVDRYGATIAGYEKEPRGGAAPTSTWVPGQRIVDVAQLPVPDAVPIGLYHLEVGLVDTATMLPLHVPDTDGHATADRVLIGPLEKAE